MRLRRPGCAAPAALRIGAAVQVGINDAAQEISLVTRGEDLLASTHVHRLLQALLELPVPQWQHHKLICDDNGKRLAKRDAARSLRSLWEAGWETAELWKL